MERRLIEGLINANLVSRQQMQRFILLTSKDKGSLVETLLDGADEVDDEAVAQQVARFYELPLLTDRARVDDTALTMLSADMAERCSVLPVELSPSADSISVAVFDPKAAHEVLATLRTAMGSAPRIFIAPRSWLRLAIFHHYRGGPPPPPLDRGDEANHDDLLERSAELEDQDPKPPPRADTSPNQQALPTMRPQRLARRARQEDQPLGPTRPRSHGQPPSPASARRTTDAEHQAAEASGEFDRTQPGGKGGGGGIFDVDGALEDFDAYLDKSEAIEPDIHFDGPTLFGGDLIKSDSSPFLELFQESLSSPSNSSASATFSLFEEEQSRAAYAGAGREAPDATLHDLRADLDENERTLRKLRIELKRQREVISTLVDLICDAGLVDRRELTRRLAAKRDDSGY